MKSDKGKSDKGTKKPKKRVTKSLKQAVGDFVDAVNVSKNAERETEAFRELIIFRKQLEQQNYPPCCTAGAVANMASMMGMNLTPITLTVVMTALSNQPN